MYRHNASILDGCKLIQPDVASGASRVCAGVRRAGVADMSVLYTWWGQAGDRGREGFAHLSLGKARVSSVSLEMTFLGSMSSGGRGQGAPGVGIGRVSKRKGRRNAVQWLVAWWSVSLRAAQWCDEGRQVTATLRTAAPPAAAAFRAVGALVTHVQAEQGRPWEHHNSWHRQPPFVCPPPLSPARSLRSPPDPIAPMATAGRRTCRGRTL